MKIKFLIRHYTNSYYKYTFSSCYGLFWFDRYNEIGFGFLGPDLLRDFRNIPENKRFYLRMKLK